ncbi:hypothetical protein D3C78_1107880 [compost metagenome]
MNAREIANIGASLVVELDRLSAQYHVKSDEHDILSWEADIIRAKSKDILENCGLNDNLKESTLLSAWGESLAKKIPNIANKARDFHAGYTSVKKCT